MDFAERFQEWLRQGLSVDVPIEVAAFAFNLCEVANENGNKFAIALIGAKTFDLADSDWACEETWEPGTRQLNIPIAFSGLSWKMCQERVITLIQSTLANDLSIAKVLTSRRGIGVGFVDGDIETIWRRN